MAAQPFFVGPTDGGMINAVEPWLLPDQAFAELTNAFQFRGRIERKYGSKYLDQMRLRNPATGVHEITMPGLPVMGLMNYETTNINSNNLIAFNTRQANQIVGGTFQDISFDAAAGAYVTPITWSGNNSEFFWGWNYWKDTNGYNLLWVTNNKDNIRYYNGITTNGWTTTFRPVLNGALASRWLDTARLIVSYRDRLVVLNTTETSGATQTVYRQRARWSRSGEDPTDNAINWDDTTPGRGGSIDAPTAEEIVSCAFFKDTLIVFFERSTWLLLYTGNETIPFVWQRINSEFGCEATFSALHFDKAILAVGDKGIIAADSVNVERIDQKIPDLVFNFHNQSEGPKRVHGIRDFYYQFAYWSYPFAPTSSTFPNRVLCYNYLESCFSIFKESITCFGYYQSATDTTWANSTFKWEQANPKTWNSALNQADFPAVVGGNQQGFVHIMYEQGGNDPSLYITGISADLEAIVTSPNHNLEIGDYVKITNVTGINDGGGNNQINQKTFQIADVLDVNRFTVDFDSTPWTPYVSGGYISIMDNFGILTKRYNPFFKQGKKARLSYLDLFIDRTVSGEFSVDFIIDETDSPVDTAIVDSSQTYGTTFSEKKMMQRVYTNTMGQFIQMYMYLSYAQMKLYAVQASGFNLHGMNLWMSDGGRLVSYDHIN